MHYELPNRLTDDHDMVTFNVFQITRNANCIREHINEGVLMSRARRVALLVIGTIVLLAGLAQLFTDSGRIWLGVLLLLSAILLFVTSARAVEKTR